MIKLFILILTSLFSILIASGQSRSAGGVVTELATGKPMEYIAVYFKNTASGCVTNYNGEFFVKDSSGADTLVVDAVGYETQYIKLKPGVTTGIRVSLIPQNVRLEGAVVRPKREKYKKKDNPAIAMMRKVIERKDSNRVETSPVYKCRLYEKLTLSLDGYNPDYEKKKKLSYLKDYIDTSEITGKPILTVSIRETMNELYHKNTPELTKIVRKAFRHSGIDKDFDHNGGLTTSFEHLLTGVDIFDNEIAFMANRFVSPISSSLALTYYKYYIMGNVMIGGVQCTDMAFVPYNSQSYGFTGRLYITNDGNYSIRKVQLNFPSKSNVNWIDKLRIDQEFSQGKDGRWALKQEDAYVNLAVFEGVQGIFAHQTRAFDNYETEDTIASNPVFSIDGPRMYAYDYQFFDDAYWETNRIVPLVKREADIAKVSQEIAQKSSAVTWMKVLEAFVSEYVPTASSKSVSKFDFGPILSFVGYNYIEGPRVRIGGMTTANLFKRWFADGYLAYGFNDRKVKGAVTLTHSFKPRHYHPGETPLDNLSLSYSYDIFSPEAIGQQHDIVTSLKVGKVTKLQYIRRIKVNYEKQWISSLRTNFWLENVRYTPATLPGEAGIGTLRYDYICNDGSLSQVPYLTSSEVGASIRWAPGEISYNSVSKRTNLNKDVPVFTLKHVVGIKGFLGGEYNYNRTEFNAFKRFHLSVAGFLDARFSMGKIWNRVPWPLLVMPAANQSFTYRRETFHTMNALEFVTDQYAQLNLTWHMKGLLFNRIPLIKRLKFRELVIFNGIYGGLTKKNDPRYSTGIFTLPQGTLALGKMPYMEVGVGVENILQLFRVVYFFRLTHRDNNLTWLGKWGGLRFGVYADF